MNSAALVLVLLLSTSLGTSPDAGGPPRTFADLEVKQLRVWAKALRLDSELEAEQETRIRSDAAPQRLALRRLWTAAHRLETSLEDPRRGADYAGPWIDFQEALEDLHAGVVARADFFDTLLEAPQRLRAAQWILRFWTEPSAQSSAFSFAAKASRRHARIEYPEVFTTWRASLAAHEVEISALRSDLHRYRLRLLRFPPGTGSRRLGTLLEEGRGLARRCRDLGLGVVHGHLTRLSPPERARLGAACADLLRRLAWAATKFHSLEELRWGER